MGQIKNRSFHRLLEQTSLVTIPHGAGTYQKPCLQKLLTTIIQRKY